MSGLDSLTRAQAKRLLDRRREGAHVSPKTLWIALYASGDLRREWEYTPADRPTPERPPEHPRSHQEQAP